jgi:hypothetical protein
MRIESSDRQSFIEIGRQDEGGFMLLSVETAIGDFAARDRSIIIEDAATFLRELNKLEHTRQGQAVLRGVEDGFELRLQSLDRAGHLWIGIRVTRAASPSVVPEPLVFSGGFPLDGEDAVKLFSDLRKLLS